jgi:hypothetical protein
VIGPSRSLRGDPTERSIQIFTCGTALLEALPSTAAEILFENLDYC